MGSEHEELGLGTGIRLTYVKQIYIDCFACTISMRQWKAGTGTVKKVFLVSLMTWLVPANVNDLVGVDIITIRVSGSYAYIGLSAFVPISDIVLAPLVVVDNSGQRYVRDTLFDTSIRFIR